MNKELPIILYVEDDPAHTEIFLRSFKKAQHIANIIHFENGLRALDYLLRREEFSDPESSPRPSLILTDLRLPKVDGLELIEQVRSDNQLSNIPIVVLTTSESDKDISKAYCNKANSYLVKPLGCDEYLNLIKTFKYYWLGLNRFLSLC
jgi:CheY-like chemotaxis protein